MELKEENLSFDGKRKRKKKKRNFDDDAMK